MKKHLIFILLVLISCESSNDSINTGASNVFNSESSSGGDSNTGIGGSMARFTIVDDYLYTIDSWTL